MTYHSDGCYVLFSTLERTSVVDAVPVVVEVVVGVVKNRVSFVDVSKSLKKIVRRPRESNLSTLRAKRRGYC